PPLAEARDVAAEHQDLTPARALGGEQQLHQRGLARAARAGPEHQLALADLPREIAQREAARLVGLRAVEQPDQRIAAWPAGHGRARSGRARRRGGGRNSPGHWSLGSSFAARWRRRRRVWSTR